MSRFLLVVLLLVTTSAHAGNLKLTVDAGDEHGRVRKHFVYDQCGGDNVSPQVAWHDAPTGTRGFALTVFDPDANAGAGWWHWIVIDLPATTHGLPEGAALPGAARSLRNDFGERGWGGPCPPAGDPPHHYVFTLYALDRATLGVPADAHPARVRRALQEHALATARVTLVYGR